MFLAPPPNSTPCTYQISPVSAQVPAAGGTFSFYVLTQPNCPPAPSPGASGGFFAVDSYVGGRVTYIVQPNNLPSERRGMIFAAGQTFTLSQFGIPTSPPPNDGVGSPQVLTGTNSPPDAPITGTNAGATSQGGEPSHAPGNAPGNSVWYSFKPAAGTSGLYSFTTSGSSFDTVMAVYACPGGDPCSFSELDQIGTNDDTTNFDKTSKVNFRASAGRLYMIAIDGKNGTTGSIKLSWRQYQQLYRVYLQTYNGDPSPLTPTTIVAKPLSGSPVILPTLVSQGVYEFDLPLDGQIYTAMIMGPTGIRWNPAAIELNRSFQVRHGEADTGGGMQNYVSNAENETPRIISGYIKNLTEDDSRILSVMIGSSRGPNPHAPVPCEPPGSEVVNGVSYATYQCQTQPQTLHDLIPGEPKKVFSIEVKSFDQPFDHDFKGAAQTAYFSASDAPTYSVGGKVLAGGGGTIVTLTYTPNGNAQPISQQTATAPDGSYKFENLAHNFYTVRARRSGFVFNEPATAEVMGDTTINIGVARACSYAASGLNAINADGGPAQFMITTNDPTCEWSASTTTSWIKINSGATVGNGPVHLMIDANKDQPRTGSVTVGDQDFTIQQRTANTINVSVSTLPEGLAFTVDRISYTTTQTFEWVAGTSHSIGTIEAQKDARGKAFEFDHWNDGGAIAA